MCTLPISIDTLSFSCIINDGVTKVYLSVDTPKIPSIDRSWTKFLVRESNSMQTVDITGSAAQKLAAFALTERLKSYFKLYPHTLASDIEANARKAGLKPIEMAESFEKLLPSLLMDCLLETKAILQRPEQKKKQ